MYKRSRIKAVGARAPLELCWDHLGIPHVFVQSTEDAFIGLGYLAGHDRLW